MKKFIGIRLDAWPAIAAGVSATRLTDAISSNQLGAAIWFGVVLAVCVWMIVDGDHDRINHS